SHGSRRSPPIGPRRCRRLGLGAASHCSVTHFPRLPPEVQCLPGYFSALQGLGSVAPFAGQLTQSLTGACGVIVTAALTFVFPSHLSQHHPPRCARVGIGIVATAKGTNPVAKAPDMDEGFWRERAEEARRIAKRLSTTWARDDLLAIAYRYEHMAKMARERKHSIGQWLRRGGRLSRVH